MNIFINGEEKSVNSLTLGETLSELGFQNMIVVTAVNGDFVSTHQREKFEISTGDRIEVLAPMQGG